MDTSINTIEKLLKELTIEEKVAQCMMIGFDGTSLESEANEYTRSFLTQGVGGIIFFGDNCRPCQTPEEIEALITTLKQSIPSHLPELFIAVDQEGGQIERLPHTIFPSGISPLALSQSRNPEGLTKEQYDLITSHLNQLGFNMNFCPTLDVNLNPNNPIIGVRSFGSDPRKVWELSKITIQSHIKNNILPVGKHFPGHGNGSIDSHIDLPTLDYTDKEFSVFKNAIKNKIPAMMVSHGYYPVLQEQVNEINTPASASSEIIQNLLISKLNYKGLIISDDMTMGAISQHLDPKEAALKAFNAGIDILIYNQSTKTEWAVYQSLVEHVHSGAVSVEKLNHSVRKVLSTKIKKDFSSSELNNKPNTNAYQIARKALPENSLQLNKEDRVLIIHPDRSKIHHYEFDQQTSVEITDLLKDQGFTHVVSIKYNSSDFINNFKTLLTQLKEFKTVLLIDYHLNQYPEQLSFIFKTMKKHPDTQLIIASIGMPPSNDAMINSNTQHIFLGSYRPAQMEALADYLS